MQERIDWATAFRSPLLHVGQMTAYYSPLTPARLARQRIREHDVKSLACRMNHHSFRVTRADVRVGVVHLQLKSTWWSEACPRGLRTTPAWWTPRTFISGIGLHDRHLITPPPNTPGYPLFTPFLLRPSRSTFLPVLSFSFSFSSFNHRPASCLDSRNRVAEDTKRFLL